MALAAGLAGLEAAMEGGMGEGKPSLPYGPQACPFPRQVVGWFGTSDPGSILVPILFGLLGPNPEIGPKQNFAIPIYLAQINL